MTNPLHQLTLQTWALCNDLHEQESEDVKWLRERIGRCDEINERDPEIEERN